MHQGGSTAARTAPRADDFCLAEDKKGIGEVIRSVKNAILHTIFGMEAANTAAHSYTQKEKLTHGILRQSYSERILVFQDRCNRLTFEDFMVNLQWWVMWMDRHMHILKIQSCSVYNLHLVFLFCHFYSMSVYLEHWSWSHSKVNPLAFLLCILFFKSLF